MTAGVALPASPELRQPVAPNTDRCGISIRGLTKRFGRRRRMLDVLRHPASTLPPHVALSDVTCEIAAGEFFGLLGPNGAGKTTLFKILATLLSPDSGSVSVHGVDVVRRPEAIRRLVAPVIADERGLYWRLSAQENLRLFATLHGLRGAARAARVREVLRLVQLEEADGRMVGTFSSGMRQRLLIARALLSRPRVLLLDEPTRSLDPVAARTFREFLRTDVARREGCTIVLATHSADEAFGLCDRVAVLHSGRVVATGVADQIAHALFGDRYHAWTSMADAACWSFLERRGTIQRPRVLATDANGWTQVEFETARGMDGAAEALASLVAAGVVIARFERAAVPLAELMERVTAPGAAPDA